MAGNYSFRGVDFDNVFLQDYKVLDEFVGAGSGWAWGRNVYSELGDATTTSRSSPVQISGSATNWKEIFGESLGVKGLKTDGTVWTWGFSGYGGHGIGGSGNINRTTPVQIGADTTWAKLAVSPEHAMAIKTDGTLWAWGYNPFSNLGDGTTTTRFSPIQIGTDNSWAYLSENGTMTYTRHAIKVDGTLWGWGLQNYGKIGDNSVTRRSTPVQIGSNTTWKQVSNGYTLTTAIKTDGTLWTWGDNTYGQLGDNTRTGRSSPVQTISAGNSWRQVAAGWNFAAAIKTDGTLWSWGRNNAGNIGDNTLTNYSSPVQTVAGGTNWKQVSTSEKSVAAIKTDGTLWTWGDNTHGQLGTNDRTHRSSPVQTVAGGTNWKVVQTGRYHTFGVYFYDSINQYPSA
jgi:alpha-tubulin suppressor-like RCC1 family protein